MSAGGPDIGRYCGTGNICCTVNQSLSVVCFSAYMRGERQMNPRLLLLLLSSVVIAGTSAAISLLLGWGGLVALLLYTLTGSTALLMLSLWVLWIELD